MLVKLIQFEWRFHSRQASFIVFLLLFMGYGIIAITSGFEYLRFSSMYNDAYNLSLLSGLISIFSIFPCMLFCINGIQRDKAHQAEEMILSTGIRKPHFFLSRFFGILSITLFLCSISLLGVFIGTLIADIIDLDPTRIHPFEFSHYLWPWLTITLPNTFIYSAILFAVSALTRQDISTYIAGGVVMLIVLISSYYINSPLIGGATLTSSEVLGIASITDLSGLASFFEQTQFLTPKKKNNQLLSLSGHFLWNRAIWMMLGGILIIAAYQLFPFRKINQRAKKKKLLSEKPLQHSYYSPKATVTESFQYTITTFRSIVILNLKSAFASIPFLSIVVIWTVTLLFIFNYTVEGSGIYGSKFPTTDLFLSHILEALPAIGILLISFYGGELVWKTRKYRFNDIIESTPVKNGALFTSTFLVLVLIPFTLILVSILVGLLFQLYIGYYDFKIGLYISSFYYGGTQLILYAIFALLVQSVISNKYLGMIISGFIMLLFGPLSSSIGLEYPLFLFNNLPSMARAYSDFTSYGQYAHRFHWLVLYWSALAGVFALCTHYLWKRGSLPFIKKFSHSINNKKTKAVLGVLVLFFILIGGYIFYNINLVNEYITNDERYDFNENYERKYKQYDSLAIPQLVSVNTKLDIYPEENKYTLEAQNIIVNKSAQPMQEIFITVPKPLNSIAIENAEQVFHDATLNTYLFKLKTPLMPNKQLKMDYKLVVQVKGFEINNAINSNGSYIKSTHFSPWLGYVNEYEIASDYERKLRGLPVRNNPVINDEHLQANAKFNFENVSFETTISTSENQTAFSSGALVKQWKSNNRNYYQFKSEGKINQIAAYFSASYEVERVNHRGIAIELYYLPEHYRNVAEIMKVTKATIDYCTDNFGKYPYESLRIGEMSIFGGANGQAMSGVVSVNEKVFKRDIENPKSFNAVARVLVHEVAHQWWGYLLTPKRTEGFMVLSESFAKYSETVVLEKLYGKEMTQKLSKHSITRYFGKRSYVREAETPLYLTKHQQHVGYSKGAIIMNAIRELIGEENLNIALKNLIDKHRNSPTATTLDFLDELYAVAPQKHHALIDDWMKRIISYDLSIQYTSYQKLENGNYKIKVSIGAKRFEVNEDGEEIEIAINEPIKIGMFKSTSDKEDEVLFFESIPIQKNETVFEIELQELPTYISIDPYHTRLDKNVKDNISILQKP